jgi:hypothetical protein
MDDDALEATAGKITPEQLKKFFKKHLIKVQGGRMYLPVSARLIWFRREHPDWSIETDPFVIDIERQYAIFRATIKDASGRVIAIGTKREDIRGFPDFIEKSETGAIGRALALCGYGTQFEPELDEAAAGRFVDSPQPTRQEAPQGNRSGQGNAAPAQAPAAAPPNAPQAGQQQQQAKTPACGKCSKPLTRSQQELSVRHYGESLCPACQKDRTRTPATA